MNAAVFARVDLFKAFNLSIKTIGSLVCITMFSPPFICFFSVILGSKYVRMQNEPLNPSSLEGYESQQVVLFYLYI